MWPAFVLAGLLFVFAHWTIAFMAVAVVLMIYFSERQKRR